MKSNNEDKYKPDCVAECGGGNIEEEISSNKKECTSCELLNDMRISDGSADVSTCASCGRVGEKDSNLKACTACKLVKYCNRECQIAHRPQHKKQCKKRAAELHDEALFKQPPLPFEDCPICFLRMPSKISGSTYMACCGKVICNGCIHAVKTKTKKHSLCVFCRTPEPASSLEEKERIKKRAEEGDTLAIYNMGSNYFSGDDGFEQNYVMALELFHKAGKLGYAPAYTNIGYAYRHGEGVDRNGKKAKHYYELAAVDGNEVARNNLGCIEAGAGNWDRALKHWMIAARNGYTNSLERIKELYTEGNATKDDYLNALSAYQEYLNEIKSVQRDNAAAFSAQYHRELGEVAPALRYY